jgi:opacity protein-like surface antigen
MTTVQSILGASILVLGTASTYAGTTVPQLTNSQPVATTGSDWQIRTALYGWATALDGDISLGARSAPVDVGFDDVFDHLDFAAMGVLEISNGQWGFLTDLFYAELSAENSLRRVDFDAELEQFMGNFLISRNVISDSNTRFDLYAGARVMAIDSTLDITRTGIFGIRRFTGSASESWVDPVIGFRAQQDLPNHFFVRAVADIGGFGVSSDITWQALLGVGYHINESSSVLLGYRSIGTDYDKGNFGYDVTSHGLLLGYEYKF